MRFVTFLTLMLSLLALAGCGSIGRMTGAPSRTTLPDHLPAGTPKEKKEEKVAVCYGAATSSKEQLATAAAEFCKEPGSTVTFLTEDVQLNECPLLKKRRAVFSCHEPH
jgi:hypothetical protein